MANQLSKTDQRRISFLSLLSSAATLAGGSDNTDEEVYAGAQAWLERMEEDGFFGDERPTQQRSERSARPAFRGPSSNNGSRGRDQARNGQGSGSGMRDPDGPPSDKQVAFLLRLTDDYTEDEVYDMTKKEVSELIEQLKA